MDRIRIYSPTQAAAGAFLGGPLASLYFIKSNYRALGNPRAERSALLYWGLATLALLALLPFLPEKFPNMAIPLATLVATRMVVEKQQLTKQAIADSETYAFQSNWRVFFAGLLAMIAFVAVGIGLFVALDAAGLITV